MSAYKKNQEKLKLALEKAKKDKKQIETQNENTSTVGKPGL